MTDAVSPRHAVVRIVVNESQGRRSVAWWAQHSYGIAPDRITHIQRLHTDGYHQTYRVTFRRDENMPNAPLPVDHPEHILAHEVRETPEGRNAGRCLFCDKPLEHINNGGDGWLGGSLVNGREVYWLMCHGPGDCDAERISALWRCTCGRDNVGPRCHGCPTLREDGEWRGDDAPDEPHAGVASQRLHQRFRKVLESVSSRSLDDESDRNHVAAALAKSAGTLDAEHEVVEAALEWASDTQGSDQKARLIRAAAKCEDARDARVSHVQGEGSDRWVVSGTALVPFLVYVASEDAREARETVRFRSWQELEDLGFLYTDEAVIEVRSAEMQQRPLEILYDVDDDILVIGDNTEIRLDGTTPEELVTLLRTHGCMISYKEHK